MRSNKGFTLIEVLVASIILFFSILTVNAAFKQYASYKLKQQKYENIYISVLSLINKLENKQLNMFTYYSGEINGFKYTARAKRVAQSRNYIYGLSPKDSGNKGIFLVTLYKIKIKMANRTFTLYKTQYRRIK